MEQTDPPSFVILEKMVFLAKINRENSLNGLKIVCENNKMFSLTTNKNELEDQE